MCSRKIRSDAGSRRAISPKVLETLQKQYKAHRRWSVRLHYDNLAALAEKQIDLNPLPSNKIVWRCMRENGWLRTYEPANPNDGQQKAADRLQQGEVRSFEVAHVHGLWHLDFHQAN